MDSVAATRNCSMKALPSIAFSEFTGSAGDVTARSIGGRTVLNHKAYQNKVKTPSQASSRNTLSKVSRAYKQLTDSQMKAWGALAEHMKGISTFGKAAEMTAHNAFVRINANREMAGEGLLVDAPEYKSDIPEVDWNEIWVTPKRVLLTGIVNPTGTHMLVVRMSAGQGVGISKGWNKTVVVSPGMVDNWGDAALTQLYTKKIGFMPEVGEKVFIELYWLDPATGFVGETMRDTRFCITEEEAKEEGFEERLEFTLDNVSPEATFPNWMLTLQRVHRQSHLTQSASAIAMWLHPRFTQKMVFLLQWKVPAICLPVVPVRIKSLLNLSRFSSSAPTIRELYLLTVAVITSSHPRCSVLECITNKSSMPYVQLNKQ